MVASHRDFDELRLVHDGDGKLARFWHLGV